MFVEREKERERKRGEEEDIASRVFHLPGLVFLMRASYSQISTHHNFFPLNGFNSL